MANVPASMGTAMSNNVRETLFFTRTDIAISPARFPAFDAGARLRDASQRKGGEVFGDLVEPVRGKDGCQPTPQSGLVLVAS